MRWIQNSLIVLILFLIRFFIFYFSYLFRVLFLVFLVIFIMIVWLSRIMYLKFLVILVYVRGVVVFILYISCICWNIREGFRKLFLLFFIFSVLVFDSGFYSKFRDVSEFIWIYLFFAFLFNRLVSQYSLNLFKVSGSLRF